jgi:hypothetical protein
MTVIAAHLPQTGDTEDQLFGGTANRGLVVWAGNTVRLVL